MKKQKNGPSWGGQNWRPGKEPGTWFRHSEIYGPMVHYGDCLVILKERRKLSQEQWNSLRQEDCAKAQKAQKDYLQEIFRDRQAELAKIKEEVEPLLKEDLNWSIFHRGAYSILKEGFGKIELYCRGSWREIEIILKYKGVSLWKYSRGNWSPESVKSPEGFHLFGELEFFSGICLRKELEMGRDNPTRLVVSPDKTTNSSKLFGLPTLEEVVVRVYYPDTCRVYTLAPSGEILNTGEHSVVEVCSSIDAGMPGNEDGAWGTSSGSGWTVD